MLKLVICYFLHGQPQITYYIEVSLLTLIKFMRKVESVIVEWVVELLCFVLLFELRPRKKEYHIIGSTHAPTDWIVWELRFAERDALRLKKYIDAHSRL